MDKTDMMRLTATSKTLTRFWFVRVMLNMTSVIKILVPENVVCHSALLLYPSKRDVNTRNVHMIATFALSRF